jgi:hypothetical protein
MAGRLGEPTFVESSVTSSALPLDWAAAKRQLSDRRANGA